MHMHRGGSGAHRTAAAASSTARSAAGLHQRQHRQPLPRAAHAAADRQRREVATAPQRAVAMASRRSL
jgi:hypothetical protein